MKLLLTQRIMCICVQRTILYISKPSPFHLFGVKRKTRISTHFTAQQRKQREYQNIVLLAHTLLRWKRVDHATG
jgi:hypothetical protein